jgi:hypothetical protein
MATCQFGYQPGTQLEGLVEFRLASWLGPLSIPADSWNRASRQPIDAPAVQAFPASGDRPATPEQVAQPGGASDPGHR